MEEHNGRHVAWWWIEGGSENDEGMVWEPMYCKRTRREAAYLMAIIFASVEQKTPEAAKEELLFYDDFRISPQYVSKAQERRPRARQSAAKDEGGAEPRLEANGASRSRKKKARQLIKEAL